MKTSKIIDIKNNIVTMSDGSQKFIDAYILELEDKLIKLSEKIESIFNDFSIEGGEENGNKN